MKEDKRNRGFPNLDKYLKDRGRKLVNYEEGSEIMVSRIIPSSGWQKKRKQHSLFARRQWQILM